MTAAFEASLIIEENFRYVKFVIGIDYFILITMIKFELKECIIRDYLGGYFKNGATIKIHFGA